ncbi:MAG TPA: DUF5916 domain-containing protein [Kofleriaceae bacterium]|nr:DUF5916 domain-containing protein [Kofleriaceae bacterium]
MIRLSSGVSVAMLLLASALSVAYAQDPVAPPPVRAHAIRRPSHVTVDGRLDDAAWQAAPKHTGFTQRFPKDGTKAQHETTFAVLYDDHAIYVGVWAHDPEPEKIRRLLTRRDIDSASDAVIVGIDSYHDKRTAFCFQLNAAGVQRDMMMSDDSQQDDSWDAVWTGDTAVTADGWTAEFRIPLNQLRFSGDASEWGLQVVRINSRTQEQSAWSPWPRSGSEVVSKFGIVDGIGVKPGTRLELLPYASAGMQKTPVDAGDPLNDEMAAIGNVGVDVKYGLGPAFTLSAAINPDFGQVEADPSQVNLSANELFFAEKRPFFVEGADLFKLSMSTTNGGQETQFYSRRIGAAPPAEPDSYDYIDSPTATTIYSAAKITGKTRGWSIGVFDAVTAEEHATIVDGEGMQSEPVVAPLTSYAVARLKRDFREGKTAVGMSATAVNRALDGTGLEPLLHDQAYSGGLQLQHRWGKNAWSADVTTVGSYVHGSEDAIARTQTSARHYWQRPDADNVSFDPTRTSMSGAGIGWMVGRLGDTKHWRFGIGGDARSPGLELNDAGFQRTSNQAIVFYYGEYHEEEPGDYFLNYNINSDIFTVNTFEPRLTDIGLECNANGQLLNYWNVHFGCNFAKAIWAQNALRGGPALRVDPRVFMNASFNTDARKPLQVSFGMYGSRDATSDSMDGGIDLGLTIQARPNIDVFLGPSWNRRDDAMQYVDEAVDEMGVSHYIFARIDQTSFGMTFRVNWTFSPKLSLQAYAQPFVASGRYRQYKDVDNPGADKFEDRFHPLAGPELTLNPDDVFTARYNGTYTFGRPDFNFAALRSTVVMRWEYRPGSSVFAIWSHGQSASGDDGRFRLGNDLRTLGEADSEDIVMVKANYWIGL